jgi:hypothetical protein
MDVRIIEAAVGVRGPRGALTGNHLHLLSKPGVERTGQVLLAR